MATVEKAANRHTPIATGWTNPENAYATSFDAVYATLASAKNTTRSGDFGFPDFTTSDIPDGSTINSVTARLTMSVDALVTGGTVGAMPRLNNADAGTELTVTSGSASNATITFTGVTLSDLRSAETSDLVEVRMRCTKGSSTTGMSCLLDYVALVVDYTAPAGGAEDPFPYIGGGYYG